MLFQNCFWPHRVRTVLCCNNVAAFVVWLCASARHWCLCTVLVQSICTPTPNGFIGVVNGFLYVCAPTDAARLMAPKHVTKFAVTFPRGRRCCGLLPARRPVRVVVGAPVPHADLWTPSDADAEPPESAVDALHQRYVEALAALYKAHAADAGYAPSRTLRIE